MLAEPGHSWQCPHCLYRENPGPPTEHHCDPRSVHRNLVAGFSDEVEAFLGSDSPLAVFERFYARRRLGDG